MIKAIIFDFFGVFVADTGRSMAESYSDPNAIFALFKEYDLGASTHPEIASKIAGLTGLSEAEVMSNMEPTDQPEAQLVRVVERLRPQTKLGLLTNAVRRELNFCISDDEMQRLFDDVVISQEVGLVKPDPAIYRLAVQRLGLEPSEILFIDDRQSNLAGATEIGMETALFNGYDDLLDQLAAYDFEVNDA